MSNVSYGRPHYMENCRVLIGQIYTGIVLSISCDSAIKFIQSRFWFWLYYRTNKIAHLYPGTICFFTPLPFSSSTRKRSFDNQLLNKLVEAEVKSLKASNRDQEFIGAKKNWILKA